MASGYFDTDLQWSLDQSMQYQKELQEWEEKVQACRVLGRTQLPTKPKPMQREKTPKICTHRTHTVAVQPPFAYSYVIVDRNGKLVDTKSYVGHDASSNFVLSVLNRAEELLPSLSPGVEMDLSEEERKIARSADVCYLCQETMSDDEKVLDHDHLTGQFLGVAHNACNLLRREKQVLTCFAHNFSGNFHA